jgi:ATP-dependent protease ClpP protease subunit
MNKDGVREKLKSDWWMDAKQSVEAGLVDFIL